MRRLLSFVAIAVLTAGGCSLAPKYARPAMPVPPTLPPGVSVTDEVLPTTPWREFITDPHLQSVVDLVLTNNRDLRVAALNAERVGALYRIQRAEMYPTLGASASADLYRSPKNMSGAAHAETIEQYSVGVGVSSWELDLFGRIRSLKAEALNQYLAQQQIAVATRTSLIATTAATYLALAADAEGRALSESTLTAQRSSLSLIQQSRNAGVATDLDVREAQSQVEAARADFARYAGFVELDRHALELLAGTAVGREVLPDNLSGVQALKAVSAGLTSDVLLRRPDILAAEYQLKAANANIGAARAAYFPRVSLTTAVGLLSPGLSGLFKAGAGTWSFAPEVTAPIFTGGARKASVEAARLQRDGQIARYETAIQSAFREVSDALSDRTALAARLDAQQALVNALSDTFRLSDARYRAGLDNYLRVLVAQRALFGAQQSLVALRVAEQQNLVTLYKVLGGGV
jgi:multidrug efflux system outer membrane protein